jgi:hypothetical protein
LPSDFIAQAPADAKELGQKWMAANTGAAPPIMGLKNGPGNLARQWVNLYVN